jgi:uncharacterized protein involved in response to NO
MTSISEPQAKSARRLSLFEYGFRPFFLLAGLQAAASIPLWLLQWLGFIAPRARTLWLPTLWHAHEMLFGFAGAALAGFLLTAVPSWTGAAPVRGWRLMLLAGVWLAARGLAFASGNLGAWFFAAADLAFLPLLAGVVGPAILVRNARRNGLFVLLLGLLFAGNLAMHLEGLGLEDGLGEPGVRLAIGILLLMITIIGGRILPAFTMAGLKAAGIGVAITPFARLDAAAILATAAFAVVSAAPAPGWLIALVAIAAAAAHLLRLARWQGWKAWRIPLLWILHVGYAWLVLGLILTTAAALTRLVPASGALHALTAGAIGSMVLAVMSRAALGQTGRPLAAGPATVLAYLLVNLGAILLVAAPFLAPERDMQLLIAGGGLWAAGFAVFVLVYLPILVWPRGDGRPG